MIKLLMFIWQLPQHIIGLLLLVILRRLGGFNYGLMPYNSKEDGTGQDMSYYSYSRMKGGISLGSIRIIQRGAGSNTIRHEYGHSIQSERLGLLYLPLVGLPSILGALAYTICPRFNYYALPWEAEADKLAGVKRTRGIKV